MTLLLVFCTILVWGNCVQSPPNSLQTLFSVRRPCASETKQKIQKRNCSSVLWKEAVLPPSRKRSAFPGGSPAVDAREHTVNVCVCADIWKKRDTGRKNWGCNYMICGLTMLPHVFASMCQKNGSVLLPSSPFQDWESDTTLGENKSPTSLAGPSVVHRLFMPYCCVHPRAHTIAKKLFIMTRLGSFDLKLKILEYQMKTLDVDKVGWENKQLRNSCFFQSFPWILSWVLNGGSCGLHKYSQCWKEEGISDF